MSVLETLLSPVLRPASKPEKHSGKPLYGVLAEFKDVDDLLAACRGVRDAGYRKWDAYTPFPVHGIEAAMGQRRTILPYLVLILGTAGCLLGIFLVWWSNATSFDDVLYYFRGYDYLISGKPIFSFAGNIPPVFEMAILFSAVTAVFGMLLLNGLPRLHHPLFQVASFKRVTDDKLFIAIEAADPGFDSETTAQKLRELGAVEVTQVEL